MVRQDARGGLKRYFKEIKSLFPVYGEREKLFLADFMSDVNDYAALHPDSDYEQFTSAFGEPKTVVAQYIADADSTYLTKQIKIARFVKAGIMVFIIAFVIMAAAVITIHYVGYIKAHESYIAREVTTVAEEQGASD
jgi:hypothetical protein